MLKKPFPLLLHKLLKYISSPHPRAAKVNGALCAEGRCFTFQRKHQEDFSKGNLEGWGHTRCAGSGQPREEGQNRTFTCPGLLLTLLSSTAVI